MRHFRRRPACTQSVRLQSSCSHSLCLAPQPPLTPIPWMLLTPLCLCSPHTERGFSCTCAVAICPYGNQIPAPRLGVAHKRPARRGSSGRISSLFHERQHLASQWNHKRAFAPTALQLDAFRNTARKQAATRAPNVASAASSFGTTAMNTGGFIWWMIRSATD